MAESQLWGWVKQYLPPGHYSRIESSTSPGIPDVAYTVEGSRGWIELKDAKSAKATRPFRRGGLRPDQMVWFREEIRASGVTGLFILARVGKTIYLISGSFYDEFNEMTKEELTVASTLLATVSTFRSPLVQGQFHLLLKGDL